MPLTAMPSPAGDQPGICNPDTNRVALTAPAADAVAICRQTITAHSKSFALASRVLAPAQRDAAAVIYTWCRRADDAVDLAPPEEQADALRRLHRELDAIYRGDPQDDIALAAFQDIVQQCRIPKSYPHELLMGMEMDVRGQTYQDMDTLLHYCFRVAGTVGLMMSHVMGVTHDGALRNAVHLGIAMQITNICRDVVEDWQRGRVYIPAELLTAADSAALAAQAAQAAQNDSSSDSDFPDHARTAMTSAVRTLLAEADRYYRSGDRGLMALPFRCAFAVRAARLIYSAIGKRIARAHYDVTAGRAVVSTWAKLALIARAGWGALWETPARIVRRIIHRRKSRPLIPQTQMEFPHDVLPV